MHDVNLENSLILTDIVDAMQDYTSIQIDIDETKVKAAELVAQKLDLTRIIGKANVDRCIDPQNTADEELKVLVVPALCYFTYARCLKMFQGTFTESGYTTEVEANDKNVAKSVANEMSTIAETFLQDVVEFLEEENPSDEAVDKSKINPRIRTFGGKEFRASN